MSAVSASGMRSSASARHISTTPSFAGQPVSVEEGVETALPDPLAHLFDQRPGPRHNPVAHVRRQFRLGQQAFRHPGLVGAVMGAQPARDGLREGSEKIMTSPDRLRPNFLPGFWAGR